MRRAKAHVLDETDSIFDSFRIDYPRFDDWLRKCRQQARDEQHRERRGQVADEGRDGRREMRHRHDAGADDRPGHDLRQAVPPSPPATEHVATSEVISG